MNQIHILPDGLINKIAAGEVIERPASVLKELVENAMDAGAGRIEIAVESGGKNLIQVTDDGSGMNEDDLLLSVQRHATSKIENYEDLEQVQSLGFRGEALASIASVSRMQIQSCQGNSDTGSQLEVVDGVIQGVSEAPCLNGTRIIVRNLFYSTPVRRKFLTSTQNELKQIVQMFKRFVFARPDLAFTFISDGEVVYDLVGQSLEDRLAAVFGDPIRNRLMEADYEEYGIRVRGVLGKMTTFKRSYGEQFLFVNGRFVSNRVINHAIFSTYGNMLERNQVPFYLLRLEMDSQRVDVNVHPTKREVRFENEQLIHQVVNRATRQALKQGGMPGFELQEPRMPETVTIPEVASGGSRSNYSSGSSGYQHHPETAQRQAVVQTDLFIPEEEVTRAESGLREFQNTAKSINRMLSQDQAARPSIWQIHNKYIMAEVSSGMIIVDQHVAHERILYEQALSTFQGRQVPGQQVLFPLKFRVQPEDKPTLEELAGFLNQLGFSIAALDEFVYAITATPADLKGSISEQLIYDIIDQYQEYRTTDMEIRDAMAASWSCKAALKAGEPLTEAEMRSLLDQLFACEHPYACPHGRPVLMNLTLDELDKRFGRT